MPAFRTMQHSIGGQYSLPLSLPHSVTRHLHERLVHGITPFRAEYEDAIAPTLAAIVKSFHAPIQTAIGPIVVSVPETRADMVEHNEQAHVMGVGANRPCRFCLVDKAHLTTARPSRALCMRRQRQPWQMSAIRHEAAEFNVGDGAALLRLFGLHAGEPTMQAAGIPMDAYRNALVDPMHARGRLMRLVLVFVKDCCSERGLEDFMSTLADFVLPYNTSALPPFDYVASLEFSQALQMIGILPLALLVCGLGPDRLFKNNMAKRFGCAPSLFYERLVKCMVLAAQANALVFRDECTEKDIYDMDAALSRFSEQWLALVRSDTDDFNALPIIHTALHLPESVRIAGTPMTPSVAADEMLHRISKRKVPNTDRRNIEWALVEHHNILGALRACFDEQHSGHEPRLHEAAKKLRAQVPRIFESSIFGASAGAAGPGERRATRAVADNLHLGRLHDYVVGRFEEIEVGARVAKKDLGNLPKQLTSATPAAQVISCTGLGEVYATGYDFTPEAIQVYPKQPLTYYKTVSFFDRLLLRRIHIRPDDFVFYTCHDEAGDKIFAPVRVRAIFSHRTPSLEADYIFVVVDPLFDSLIRHDYAPSYRIMGMPCGQPAHLLALSHLSSRRPPHFVPIPDLAAVHDHLTVAERFDCDEADKQDEAESQRKRGKRKQVEWPDATPRIQENQALFFWNEHLVSTA
jgi:hypothetical protein